LIGQVKKSTASAALLLLLLLGCRVVGSVEAKSSSQYDPSRLEGLSWVILQVKQDYVDPARISPPRMLKSILETIEQRIPEVEIKLADGQVTTQVGAFQQRFSVGQPTTIWEMNFSLQPLIAFIASHLEADTDPKDVEYAAIDGMLSTLDPHSNLLPPELFREMSLKTTGEFGGLGIRITIRDGALTIISPLPDTPAARLGLRAMDQIVRIGDQSTVNMPLDEAVNMLRGKPGTKVTIWVMRKGWSEPHKYVITRERITVHSVESHLLEGRIGYIQIQDFGRHTDEDVARHLFDLKRQAKGLRGLIIDLRNNAGGLMKAAVKVADLFLDRGVIVATVAYGEDSTAEQKVQKDREEKRATADGTEKGLPLVVLVNNGSASASEILAGALKNLDRALVMGQQTFGKGTVQILNDRVPEAISGACLKLTVAEYLIPGDISIQEVGVTPDIELVPMVLEKDDVRAFVSRSHFREEDIPAHLRKQHRQRLKPAKRISYLEEKEQEKAAGEQEQPPLQEPAFREDFSIKLARRILGQVRSPHASGMLDEAVTLLDEVAGNEQKKMTEALSALGVDWSPAAGTAGPAPRLITSFELAGEGLAADGAAVADKKIVMKLVASNKSQQPVYRLWAESKSKSALFDKREFIFGKLAPGQTRSWEVPVKVPRGALSRADEVRFIFHCQGGQAPAPLETVIRSRGLERPSFSLAWQLLEVKGNGDGLIQPGESASLRVKVINSGPGRAFKVKGLLKNDAGRDLFLKRGKGRFNLKEIAARADATGSFVFDVRPDSKKRQLPVELTIWDADLGTNHTAKLKLPVFAKAQGPIKSFHARLAPLRRRTPLLAGPHSSMPPLAQALAPGILQADRLVAGYWRVVADDAVLGWVASRLVKRTRKRRPPARIRDLPQLTPPRIKAGRLPLLVDHDTREIKLHLEVSDRDRPVRDVTVWVGNDKVLLRSGSTGNGHQLTVDTSIGLHPGPNLITVVAREGTKFATQLPLVVTRAGGIDWKEEDQKLADGQDASLILE